MELGTEQCFAGLAGTEDIKFNVYGVLAVVAAHDDVSKVVSDRNRWRETFEVRRLGVQVHEVQTQSARNL